MDIKKTVDEMVEKIKKDPALLKKFSSDPVGTLESMTGIDLPDDQLKPVADAIKAKLAVGKASDVLGKLF